MKNKKGLSLIILVITIILVLIISGVTITALSKANVIHEAESIVADSDFKVYKEELENKVMEILSEDEDTSIEDIEAFDVFKIKEYIPSLKKEDEGKVYILKGQLVKAEIIDWSVIINNKVEEVKELKEEADVALQKVIDELENADDADDKEDCSDTEKEEIERAAYENALKAANEARLAADKAKKIQEEIVDIAKNLDSAEIKIAVDEAINAANNADIAAIEAEEAIQDEYDDDDDEEEEEGEEGEGEEGEGEEGEEGEGEEGEGEEGEEGEGEEEEE